MSKFRKLVVIFVFALMLVGCGSKSNTQTITCTNTTTDEDGYKTTDTIEVTAVDGKVTKVVDTNVSETDPSLIDFSYNIVTAFAEKLNEANGMSIVYTKEDNNKLKFVMNVDYSKLDVEKIKESLGSTYDDNNFYSNKDITLDSFKENHLKNYTCE